MPAPIDKGVYKQLIGYPILELQYVYSLRLKVDGLVGPAGLYQTTVYISYGMSIPPQRVHFAVIN